MKVNLLPFNDAAYQLIVDKGYSHIVIEPKLEKKYAAFFHERELQLLKAVKKCDNLPIDTVCEPVRSQVIKAFLQDRGHDYFVILT